MRTAFQIVFCLLSAACVVSSVFIWVYCGFLWFLVAVAAALLFACLMFLMKNGNPFRRTPKEPHPDYMDEEKK